MKESLENCLGRTKAADCEGNAEPGLCLVRAPRDKHSHRKKEQNEDDCCSDGGNVVPEVVASWERLELGHLE